MKPTTKRKSKHYTCRYWKRKLTIAPFSMMEFFKVPLVWHRVAHPNAKLFPLCSTKHQTHVLLIVDVMGCGHILASPQGSPRGHAYKGHTKRWEEFCDEHYVCWWSYLPDALPPQHPYKKRYTEAELVKGYTRWKVHESAVMDDIGTK